MNNWLPCKAVISVGVVGYLGPTGWVLYIIKLRVNNNNNENNNDFQVLVGYVENIFHIPNISNLVTNFELCYVFRIVLFITIFIKRKHIFCVWSLF